MIRDWDLWAIYLDAGWVDAESAKRLARIALAMQAVVNRMQVSAAEVASAFDRLAREYSQLPTARR